MNRTEHYTTNQKHVGGIFQAPCISQLIRWLAFWAHHKVVEIRTWRYSRNEAVLFQRASRRHHFNVHHLHRKKEWHISSVLRYGNSNVTQSTSYIRAQKVKHKTTQNWTQHNKPTQPMFTSVQFRHSNAFVIHSYFVIGKWVVIHVITNNYGGRRPKLCTVWSQA